MEITMVAVLVVAACLLFLFCRELACWYLKTTGIYNVLLAILEELKKR